MTAEQLEELLGKVTQGEWVTTDLHSDYIFQILRRGNGEKDVDIGNVADATLIALAPSLARRVLAAEKLLQYASNPHKPSCITQRLWSDEYDVCDCGYEAALTAYREASK